jgi:hypothetical protein
MGAIVSSVETVRRTFAVFRVIVMAIPSVEMRRRCAATGQQHGRAAK